VKTIFRAQDLADISDLFKVFATTERCQAAIMNLSKGEVSGEFGTDHPHADQVLIVLEGGGSIRIGDEETILEKGDVAIVPAGTPHQVHGPSKSLNLYSPVAYPDEA
jgi:mannose-6-phosphate isomerase-like protein (cupin superfamily)